MLLDKREICTVLFILVAMPVPEDVKKFFMSYAFFFVGRGPSRISALPCRDLSLNYLRRVKAACRQ